MSTVYAKARCHLFAAIWLIQLEHYSFYDFGTVLLFREDILIGVKICYKCEEAFLFSIFVHTVRLPSYDFYENI